MSLHNAPLIGLPGRRRTAAEVSGFPASLHHLDIDVYLADYTRKVLAAGGLPVHLPLDGDPAAYVGRLDGLLLTGGTDIEPRHYASEPDGNGDYEPLRDTVELTLLEAAMADDVPVLGICRGLQLVNIHAGGNLHQHVPEHARYDVHPDEVIHRVCLEPHSRLGLLYGAEVEVNSLHHQTIDRVGEGLLVAGTADDGTIEALEMPGRDVLAVQWHPEMRSRQEPVFDWLIKQAGNRSS